MDIVIRYVGGLYPWRGTYRSHAAAGQSAEEVFGMLMANKK